LKLSIYRSIALLVFSTVLFLGCTENERVVLTDNEPFDPRSVPTVRVENYVNRIFIDLLGREPIDSEMVQEVRILRENKLSYDSRSDLIMRLQTDTTYVEGDSSYKHAYYQRIYDMAKARLCEGAADGEFTRYVGLAAFSIKVGRLDGDSIRVYAGLEQQRRNQTVVDSRVEYRNGDIELSEMFARMLDNNVYDVINMNTFNFVNASFDDLFFRFPFAVEFDQAYQIIERNEPGTLFGGVASNKREYCILLTNSVEFSEGLIHWAYLSLVGRTPSTQEVHNLIGEFVATHNFQEVQRKIMITNEYAIF
jgi:hypothetical protein